MTHNEIVAFFETFADGHALLRHFAYGEVTDADFLKEQNYPMMFVVPQTVDFPPEFNGMKNHSFDVYFLDVPAQKTDDLTNIREIHSDMAQVATDFRSVIGDNQIFAAWRVRTTGAMSAQFLTNDFADTLSGVVVSTTISQPSVNERCLIPGITAGGSPADCPDATVELNGVEVGTVASGGTIDIDVLQGGSPVGSLVGSDWIIPVCTDANVEVNGNAYDTVASGATIDVLVEYENGTPVGTIVGNVVEIPDPYAPVLTIFQRPVPIGSSLSATSGTTAWRIANGYYAPVAYAVGSILRPQQLAFSDLPVGSAHGYWLAYNNTHGHRYRFTLSNGSYARKLNDWFDINGVAIATPGDVIIYDHLTGLQWRNADTFTAQTWNNSLPNPATTYVGETGWWMPALEEAMTIFDINDDSNYLALVMTRGSRTWLSDQNQTSTANAYIFNSNGVTTLAKSTTASTTGIICKHF